MNSKERRALLNKDPKKRVALQRARMKIARLKQQYGENWASKICEIEEVFTAVEPATNTIDQTEQPFMDSVKQHFVPFTTPLGLAGGVVVTAGNEELKYVGILPKLGDNKYVFLNPKSESLRTFSRNDFGLLRVQCQLVERWTVYSLSNKGEPTPYQRYGKSVFFSTQEEAQEYADSESGSNRNAVRVLVTSLRVLEAVKWPSPEVEDLLDDDEDEYDGDDEDDEPAPKKKAEGCTALKRTEW